MKRYVALLAALWVIATVGSIASAAGKKDELRYEVNVTIRFNSLNPKELSEVQKVLDGLAAKSCKTKIELEKLPKEDGLYLYNGSGSTTVTFPRWITQPDNGIILQETEEDNE